MANTAADVVACAQSFVGYVSGAQANKFNAYYNEHVGNIGNYAWAWCSAFEYYISNTNGGDYPATANCTSAVNAFKSRGTWLGKVSDPKPGDIIFFNWFDGGPEEDHVGIVEYVDGQVHTIEGNTGGGNGQCARRTYAKDYACILGYGRPGYLAAVPVAPARKNIIQYPANYHKNQVFKLGTPDVEGYCTITDLAAGRCMDVAGASTKPGAQVIAYKPNGGVNQMFKIEQRPGMLSVIHPKIAPDCVLDISGASREKGAKLITWTPNGHRNQEFVFVPTNDKDCYYILSANSLMCLDVAGG